MTPSPVYDTERRSSARDATDGDQLSPEKLKHLLSPTLSKPLASSSSSSSSSAAVASGAGVESRRGNGQRMVSRFDVDSCDDHPQTESLSKSASVSSLTPYRQYIYQLTCIFFLFLPPPRRLCFC